MTPLIEKIANLMDMAKAAHVFENSALEMAKRIIVASLPALLISFTIPTLLPVMTVLSAFLLYYMVKDIQHKAISFDHMKLLLFASLPVYAFFIAWCLALAHMGHPERLSSIATHFLLAVICLWPTFVDCKKHIQEKKKSPFKPLYFAVSGLLVVQQILTVI